MDAAPARKIDRYVLGDKLGHGGMAVVFRAQDPELGRDVAVKVIKTDRSVFGDETVERFQRELRSLGLVTHPNVIRIYDGGLEGDHPYLVTELIDGKTLEDVIEDEGKMTVATAVKHTVSLLEALEAVHSAGIVHRDIKPSNLMVTREGRLVLMDFGIALAAFSDSLTRTGDVPGTLAYLPPECLGGKKATVPSDIFQVGLVLYEMLVGKPLFAIADPRGFLMMHGDLPPRDLESRRPGLPAGIAAALSRSLEPEPATRFQGAREMLSAVLSGERPSKSRIAKAAVRRPSSADLRPVQQEAPAGRRVAVIAAGGFLAALFAGVAVKLLEPAVATPPARFDVSVSRDALDVSWKGAASYRGAVEVTVPRAGTFVAEEPSEAREHRLRIPGTFEGLELTLRVGPSGGQWSEPLTVR